MKAGTRAIHKTFGIGTVQETNKLYHPGLDETNCYFAPDVVPENHASILLVDTEALKEITNDKDNTTV